MATTIGSLALKITAGVGDLKAKLAEGTSMIGRFASFANSSLRSTFTGVGGIATKLVSGGDPFKMMYQGAKDLVGAIPYVGGFFSAGISFAESFMAKISSVIDQILEVRSTAFKLGTDVKTMSELLVFAGGGSEALIKGLGKLQQKLGDAASGGKATAREFALLGLDAKELSGMNLREALGVIADQFNKITNPAQRAHFLFTAFGKAGAEMGDKLIRGSKGIEEAAEICNRFGLALTDADATAAAAAKKGLKEFDHLMKGIWTQIAVQAIPYIRLFQKALKDSMGGMGDVASTVLDVSKAIVSGALQAYNVWKVLLGVWHSGKLVLQGFLLFMVGAARRIVDVLETITPGGAGKKLRRDAAELKALEKELTADVLKTADKIGDDFKFIDVDAVGAQIDALKEKLKGVKLPADAVDLETLTRLAELKDQMDKMLESTKSPFEKWSEDLAKVNDALAAGVFAGNMDDYLKLRHKLREEFRNLSGETENPFAKSIESLEKVKQLFKDDVITIAEMDRAASHLKENLLKAAGKTENPFEKWKTSMAQLNELFEAGRLGMEDMAEIAGQLTEQLLSQKQLQQRTPPAALVRGSAAEFSAVNSFRREGDKNGSPIEQLKQIAEKQKKAEEQTQKNTKEIAEALKDGRLFKIIGM